MAETTDKSRLALITFVVSVGTMLITYAVTVTLVYARLDKEQATQAIQIDYMRQRIDAVSVGPSRAEMEALRQQLTTVREDLEYLSRAMEPEVPRRRRPGVTR